MLPQQPPEIDIERVRRVEGHGHATTQVPLKDFYVVVPAHYSNGMEIEKARFQASDEHRLGVTAINNVEIGFRLKRLFKHRAPHKSVLRQTTTLPQKPSLGKRIKRCLDSRNILAPDNNPTVFEQGNGSFGVFKLKAGHFFNAKNRAERSQKYSGFGHCFVPWLLLDASQALDVPAQVVNPPNSKLVNNKPYSLSAAVTWVTGGGELVRAGETNAPTPLLSAGGMPTPQNVGSA